MVAKPEYIVALDYGNKRIGVAIAHETARLPRPLTTLNNGPELVQEIQQLVEQEAAKLLVVGLPRGMDGGYTAQTRAAEAFMQALAAAVSVPVVPGDETLTSVDAEATLKQRKQPSDSIDAVAASLILERYLEEQGNQHV